MKKVFKATVLGVSIMGMATVATAAVHTHEINIFGASAQHEFWNDAADNFLSAPTTSNGMGCTTVKQDCIDAKNCVAWGQTCAGLNQGEDILIRYSSKASIDGPRAAYGIDPESADSCSANTATTPNADPTRKMVDEDQVDWNPATLDGGTKTKCVDVTIGTSDVASESFTQITTGKPTGYLGTGTSTTYDTTLKLVPGEVNGLRAHKNIVVPFAFFMNGPAINAATQTVGSQTISQHGTGDITNISRIQAMNVFGGKVYNWNQFGSSYPNKKVVACLRHAGSGTHATLDQAVFRGELPIKNVETTPTALAPNRPYIYFHAGSSDLMGCVNANGNSTAKPTAIGTHLAIGYADADITEPNSVSGVYAYPNAVRINYNGFDALKGNLTNANYDFWSSQWAYQYTGDLNYSAVREGIQAKMLDDFASDAAQMPVNRQAYWATQGEMKVNKATDASMPTMK